MSQIGSVEINVKIVYIITLYLNTYRYYSKKDIVKMIYRAMVIAYIMDFAVFIDDYDYFVRLRRTSRYFTHAFKTKTIQYSLWHTCL